MKAAAVNFIFILFVLINITSAKNFRCSYVNAKVQILNVTSLTCEYRNIVYRGENETFSTILPNELPKNMNTDHIYEDSEEYVERISFKSSRIYSIPNSIFSTFSNIRIFDASRTRLHEFNSLSFNRAEFLTHIHLQNNRLSVIRDYVFVHSKNLKVLDLSSNVISVVQKHAFSSLKNLEQLNLAENKIKSIQDGTFEPIASVYWIWLNDNEIEFITSHVFGRENKNLTGINLDRNAKLTAIAENAFKGLTQLQFLFLAGCGCINENFKNKVVHNNIAIKYSLKSCRTNYIALFPDPNIIDEKDFSSDCMEFMDARREELKFLNEQIRKMNLTENLE